MKNRAVATALILQMIFALIPPVFADGNRIEISDRAGFEEFARKCTLDTWSRGKTVELLCDIDFSNTDFSPVPSFCGTFNGNGHTISGISCREKGSYRGLFRYVCQGGRVSGLNVEGSFIPGGSKSYVGGIVGENSGILENCTFTGTVKGENVIGGIAGNNADNGKIISCTSSGSVTGENSTGGIAGKNSGFIQNCTNEAAVNTVYEEKKSSISDIDADTGAIIESYKNIKEENEEKSALGHSDTGGIVGISTGIIQGCINNAAVGYSHVGYNVGGIAGRQSGYMLGCENNGRICGRKDVGGIVGQAEPYIVLSASEGTLRSLRTELDSLNSMVNRLITDTDNLGDDVRKNLDEISDHARLAGDSAEDMLNRGTDFVDDNVSEINAQAAILSNTLDKMTPVLEAMEECGENLTDALATVGDALDDISLEFPELGDDLKDISDALSYISNAETDIKNAVSRLGKAKDSFDEGLKFSNPSTVKQSMTLMLSAIRDIATAKRKIRSTIDRIGYLLGTKPEDFEALGVNAEKIAECLKIIGENTEKIISALGTISESMDAIVVNIEINNAELETAARHMDYALGYLDGAMYYIVTGFGDLAESLRSAAEKLADFTGGGSDDVEGSVKQMADGFRAMSYAADDLKTAFGDLKDIVSDLANEDTPEFVKLGDEFKSSSERLFESLGGISDGIEGLKDTLSGEKNKISRDLSSVSNQFNLVMNLLADEVDEIKSGIRSVGDIFLDVSDEEIEKAYSGKIAECHNYGTVEADRNTGGIAGAVAIEFAKDPEDETEKPDTLNFTYRTRAVLQSCVNDGDVIGKKDCAGGIAGLAEIGTIYKCEGYGNTKSTNGNYVGGVAGKSDSVIRKSYAKCEVEGKRYNGGIAGKGETVAASCAIVEIKGEENNGAICGGTENGGNLYANLFTDNGVGGVDGISYEGRAEPVSFETLSAKSGIPPRFISFSVSFVADGKTVGTEDIKYGDETARIKYPELPEKEGFFGRWIKPEEETVTKNLTIECEYTPYIKVLASEEKSENGKLALALAEGEFTDEARLHITESEKKPPVNINTRVYDVVLSKTDISDGDAVTVRVLNEDKCRIAARVLKDGKWERIKTANRGKYTVLQTYGVKSTICLTYEKRGTAFAVILPILMCIALGAVWIFKRRRRIKRGNG